MEELLNRLLEFEQLVKAEVLTAIPLAIGLLWKRIKSALGPERLETLTSIARVAVFAAEELGHKGGKVGEDISGRAKLEFAVGRLFELASRAGLKVSEDEAKALIEAVLNEVRPYAQLPDLPALPANEGGEVSPVRDPNASAFEPAH